jgi:hypothetical protein
MEGGVREPRLSNTDRALVCGGTRTVGHARTHTCARRAAGCCRRPSSATRPTWSSTSCRSGCGPRARARPQRRPWPPASCRRCRSSCRAGRASRRRWLGTVSGGSTAAGKGHAATCRPPAARCTPPPARHPGARQRPRHALAGRHGCGRACIPCHAAAAAAPRCRAARVCRTHSTAAPTRMKERGAATAAASGSLLSA